MGLLISVLALPFIAATMLIAVRWFKPPVSTNKPHFDSLCVWRHN